LIKWEGAFTILMTAFRKDSGIDINAIRSSIDFVIRGGVYGVVASQSTTTSSGSMSQSTTSNRSAP
jgi:dihydrodipicolinate synthase/N-acetylneuraminate lyase